MALCSSDKDDIEFATLSSKRFIGTARADISSLEFIEGGRQIDNQIIERLISIFKDMTCRRLDPDNYIPVLITQVDLNRALRVSKVQQNALKIPASDGSYHFLRTSKGQKLKCVYGKHRVKAAERYFGEGDRWWTITLFLTRGPNGICPSLLDRYKPLTPSDPFEKFALRRRDSFLHQAKLNDGEIYCRFNNCKTEEEKNYWRAWLTSCKKTALDALMGHEDLKEFFNGLLCFPGMWAALLMGNIQKHTSLQTPEVRNNWLFEI
jgi:hypothetical protein